MSLPPACSNRRRSGLVASQYGASFSICANSAAVNGSSFTCVWVRGGAPIEGVPNVKSWYQAVMNDAGVAVPPGVNGRLALVPLLQLNSLPSEYPPGYRCCPVVGSTGPLWIFSTTAISAGVRQFVVSVAEHSTESRLNFCSHAR